MHNCPNCQRKAALPFEGICPVCNSKLARSVLKWAILKRVHLPNIKDVREQEIAMLELALEMFENDAAQLFTP
jgi:hypothetical protein